MPDESTDIAARTAIKLKINKDYLRLNNHIKSRMKPEKKQLSSNYLFYDFYSFIFGTMTVFRSILKNERRNSVKV